MIRFCDVVLGVTGLLLLSPLLLMITILGVLDTGSPIFRQKRLGKDKQPFILLKFRTMKINTEQVATHLADSSAVTRLGKFLRRTKLDELPQLYNVIKGDMSIIGPRPCLLTQSELIAERDSLGIFSVRPGITGLAQIQGVDMSNPRQLALKDAEMISQINFVNYLKLILLTLIGNGFQDRVR